MTSGPRLRWLDRLEENLIATLMGLATLVIFVAVLHRYLLSHLGGLVVWTHDAGYADLSEVLRTIYFWLLSIRLTWAQELCIYLFVWMAKFGAAYGVRTGIHVGVDVLVNRLPPRARHRHDSVWALMRRHLYRVRRLARNTPRHASVSIRASLGRAGSADVAHLPVLAAGFIFDVLPFPSSCSALFQDRDVAAL